jgi:DNA-binding beta-propeller fold protein YncE
MGPLPPPPPEIEERRAFEAPRAGARFVFVANPRRDTVAVIDSTTLAIRSVNAGDTPTYLTTLPGKDVAIVLNVDSRDATILRAEGTIARTSTVPVVPGVNALAVSPGGGHVVAWFDSSARGTRAVGGSFQDLSVIALGDGSAGAPDRSMAFTVGFRPTDVRFSSDGSAAFVVTEDGVSIIGLANLRGPGVARLVPVDDPAATTLARDVSVTPNGKFALSRTEASPRIRLVDLETGAVRTLDLGSPVTDLDLSPGGDYAVAVLRQKAAVIRIAIPAGFADDTARTTRLLEAAE